jgi:putative tryptophan/tyrosine transport system substrate-binding protein
VKRRAFISLLGGAAVVWPCAVRAQQTAMPVIGFLNQGSAKPSAYLAAAFQKGLNETGYTEGYNVAIEYRWAESQYTQLPELAADLISRKVSVLAVAFLPAALAAKAVTSTIPICFVTGADPVNQGLVTSLNRPGGNVTGVAFFSALLGAKRLGLLHELVPTAGTFALLVNPTNANAESLTRDLQAAAHTLGKQILVLPTSTEREIDGHFATLDQQRVGAHAFFDSQRDHIVELVARGAIPAIYERREAAMAGGLMSYGANVADAYHQAGIYTGRLLKGEKPADLPVIQPTKLEFVINLKTAKALGLTIPPGVLAIADEVIE